MSRRLLDPTGIVHPEFYKGFRIWLDPLMADTIDRIQNGDPSLGWEGDPRLVVRLEALSEQTGGRGPVWALWWLDDNDEYHHVVRTEPGVPFDERIIHWLVAHDRQRRGEQSLFEQIEAANTKVEQEREKTRLEYITEELNPRLQHALRKDLGESDRFISVPGVEESPDVDTVPAS